MDNRGYTSEQPSSSTHPRVSEGSEGYPSWLPKRPPPPAPASTYHSSVNMFERPPTEQLFSGGRKATPRSVRVVSLQDAAQSGGPFHHRDTTDQTRVTNPLRSRVWSRATTAGLSPTLFSAASRAQDHLPRPKFRSTGLHPELLRNPSLFARLYFYLLPLIAFYHIPLQTFFDFNAVFILLQVAKHPNPQAPGVPGSGKDWALGAAAYIACWLSWILVVTLVYELIYSFYRRWRVKRPLITPLYLSASAFNLVSMTSYTNFCFMNYIRFSAFFGENGSLRDGIAETFWFYSQNLPTVALLLPRAALSLALLLAFSSPQSDYVALVDAGISPRDSTFFRPSDGTLTDYARGVLIANAAWTAWRTLVLFWSWIGLWVVSGQACAGLCGPRYRWEEEDAEKTMSVYSDAASESDALSWSWKACTRMRIHEAYDFCLTVKPPARWNAGKKDVPEREVLGVSTAPAFEVEQVLAAVGFPSVPPPARRGMLSDELFERPKAEIGSVPTPPPELSDIIPKVVKRNSKDREVVGPSGPLMALPYPFKGYGAQISSEDQIPFPPSPGSRKEKRKRLSESEEEPKAEGEAEEGGDQGEQEEEQGEEDDDDEEEEEEEEDGGEESSEAQPRTSGSMSSLGQPIVSRYPFQFRRPTRGHSYSSSAPTHSTPSKSTPSSNSRSSNRDTSSDSPMSHDLSSNMSSPTSGYGIPIPMPPRHPQYGRGRARAGTVPSAFPPSPSPITFPSAIHRARANTRVDNNYTEAFGRAEPTVHDSYLAEDPYDDDDEEHEMEMMEQPEPEGPHEAAEGEDSVGLLGVPARSPRSSLVSSHRRRGKGFPSGTSSRTSSQSGSSSSRSRTGSAVRSRTQSLIQSIGAASRSSLDLVQAIRSRANSSVARLEEEVVYSSDARSHSGSASDGMLSSAENYTFGHPLRTELHEEAAVDEPRVEVPELSSRLHEAPSAASISAPSERPSEVTVSRSPERAQSPEHQPERLGIPIPTTGVTGGAESGSSHPDISTAAQSFVTAPATIVGTSSSGRTQASWAAEDSHMVDRSESTWNPA
ncbi:hypothetical protein SERLA73DRAFT_169901 [Serpula lacrymans var. lacrymans S7.3]|uniref:Proteophosphoglycan ppg4 n=1 Tax=Serpula lacrymans var. lacrymans (strain S7.3) TaxID=936435 RepID=F8Q348_SERL3|nr:hypothetical protein SERLA73DRAFT_169901 [Serpula lacrymans var. lacrymans S7.3]